MPYTFCRNRANQELIHLINASRASRAHAELFPREKCVSRINALGESARVGGRLINYVARCAIIGCPSNEMRLYDGNRRVAAKSS